MARTTGKTKQPRTVTVREIEHDGRTLTFREPLTVIIEPARPGYAAPIASIASTNFWATAETEALAFEYLESLILVSWDLQREGRPDPAWSDFFARHGAEMTDAEQRRRP